MHSYPSDFMWLPKNYLDTSTLNLLDISLLLKMTSHLQKRNFSTGYVNKNLAKIWHWNICKLNCLPRKICQKFKSSILSNWILVQGFKMPKFLDKYKTIFLGIKNLTLKFSKNFFPMLELPINLFWSLWKVSVDFHYCCFFLFFFNIYY